MKNCENCIHFYECDNMGTYEDCLPDMKYYEEDTKMVYFNLERKNIMKKLVNLVQIVENNRECVILEVVGSSLDMIKLGCFNGNEAMMRLTKGANHTCTVWTNDGKNYSWSWGSYGYTLVSNQLSEQGRLIQDCITQDFEIYIDKDKNLIEQTLHIKSLEDVKHNSHMVKIMYWEHTDDHVCCHLDGQFFSYFKNRQDNLNHFLERGYKMKHLKNEVATTGCMVEHYEISR